jgi:predicted amidophosphoribosyltransferase
MALVNCRECEKEVSDQAETCPHCGIDSPKFEEEKKYTLADKILGKKNFGALFILWYIVSFGLDSLRH